LFARLVGRRSQASDGRRPGRRPVLVRWSFHEILLRVLATTGLGAFGPRHLLLSEGPPGCQEPKFLGPTDGERGRAASGLEAPEERLQFLGGVQPVLLERIAALLEEVERPALGLVLAEERLVSGVKAREALFLLLVRRAQTFERRLERLLVAEKPVVAILQLRVLSRERLDRAYEAVPVGDKLADQFDSRSQIIELRPDHGLLLGFPVARTRGVLGRRTARGEK